MYLNWRRRTPQRHETRSRFLRNKSSYASFHTKPITRHNDSSFYQLQSGVYSGTHGFRQKKSIHKPKEDDPYKNFNVRSTKLRRTQTRCGIIAFNPSCEKVICIQNKAVFDRYGIIQWGLPKGHMDEKDRNYSSCASREFKEETGITHRLEQKHHLFKRVNNTMYFPIIVSDHVRIAPIDTVEIMAAEWKNITQITTLGIETNEHNQDLKVLLHRYINEMIIMAKKNNDISISLKNK